MELMDIPFIGSFSERTVLAMIKTMTRSMMIECGIPCPPGKIIFEDTIFNSDDIEYPCVVKPTTTENSGKTPIMAAPRRCLLFFKIEVRPRSCRSYHTWRP